MGKASREFIEAADLLGQIPDQAMRDYVLESDWYRRDPEAPSTISRIAQIGASRGKRVEELIRLADDLSVIAKREGDLVGVAMSHNLRVVALTQGFMLGDRSLGEGAFEACEASAEAWKRVGAGPERIGQLIDRGFVALELGWEEEKTDSYFREAVAESRAEQERPMATSLVLFVGGDYALRGIGSIRHARMLLETALEIQECVAPDSIDIAQTLHRLGYLEGVDGNPGRAFPYLQRAELMLGNHLSGSREHAWVVKTTGVQYHYLGNLEEAERFYLQALEMNERLALTSSRARLSVAEDHFALGAVDCQLDRWEAGREHLEESLAINEELVPGSPRSANVLLELGHCVSMRQGDFVAAEEYYRRALAILEERYSQYVNYGLALFRLGEIALLQGNIPEAEGFFLRTREFYEVRDVGPDAMGLLYQALGDLEQRRKDYGSAVEYYTLACETVEKEDLEKLAAARYRSRLGAALFSMGKIDQAEQHLEDALAWYGELLEDHPQSVLTLNSLGDVSMARGRLNEALEYYRRALRIRETNLGSSHYLLSSSLHGIATALAGMGRKEEAIETALRLETIRIDHLKLALIGHTERQALEYAAWKVGGLDIVLSLMATGVATDPEKSQEVWQTMARSRGIVLDEMSSRRRILEVLDDGVSKILANEYARACGRWARLAIRGPVGSDLERYRRTLEEARTQMQHAQRALAKAGYESRRSLNHEAVGLDEYVDILPLDTALVSYLNYQNYTFERDSSEKDSGVPTAGHYAVFIVRADSDVPIFVPLGPAVDIDRLVQEVHDLINDVAVAPDRGRALVEKEYRRVAGALRVRVWDAMQPQLDGIKRLFLIPDGQLNLVNLAALPIGGNGYLVEAGKLIHFLSAERDLFVDEGSADTPGVLILGDPAFDEPTLSADLDPTGNVGQFGDAMEVARRQVFRGSRSSCGDFRSMRFEPLPGSAEEIDQLNRLWETEIVNPSEGSQSGVELVKLRGRDANEWALKTIGPTRGLLHLATHGFFLEGRCDSVMTVSENRGRAEEPGQNIGENPLILSGLALAGANLRQASGPGEEDGIVTAEEIAALDLGRVQWAVLSACDTGVGEVRSGEGVFGLRRAFQIAGARTLVMSLWPVDDEVSREWMIRLYRARFVDGQSTVEAVHKANLTLLENRRENSESTHPFFWAGFIASGDWR
jgi:CHAT domain-containing protein/tetratricopeptide (TPR) repeat protein